MSSSSWLPIHSQRSRKAAPQLGVGVACLIQRVDTGRADGVEAAGPAIACRCAGAEPRSNETLAFEALERGMDRACCDRSAEAVAYLFENRAAVRAGAEAKNREQHGLLERTKGIGHLSTL